MSDENTRTARGTALVLGAAGFIGRHVCREMNARGFTVHGVGHGGWSAAERSSFGVSRWHEADITLETLRVASAGISPDVVLHCGGSGTVAHSYRAPASDFDRSVGTTLAALAFTREQASSPCFVLVSSAAVYGDQGDVDIDEGARLVPMSPYGYHKVMAEQLCESYHRFFNVRTRVVRLFSVYGEGLQKQLLWDAMNKYQRGEHSFFGTGHELRDWIHVDDAARLLALAATASQAPYEIYNGAHTHATTRDVLTKLALAADMLAEPLFNNETHIGNPRRLTANCGHARRQLTWTPAVALDEGLRRYAAWFKTEIAT